MVNSKEATMESTARLRIWVLVALIVVPLLLSLPIAWYTGEWGGLALNLCTELIGAGVTYTLLELVIGRRERREIEREAEKKEREAKKADLIRQMSSSVKDVAVPAAEELRRHGWLRDGSLQRAFLAMANLEGTDLYEANLQGAVLARANLEGAHLEGAFLSDYTTLPDGTKWTPDTDMTRFTDPKHPDFWFPDTLVVLRG